MLKKFLLAACLLALCHSCFAEVKTAAALADGAHITAAATTVSRDNGYEDYRHAWSRYNDALRLGMMFRRKQRLLMMRLRLLTLLLPRMQKIRLIGC